MRVCPLPWPGGCKSSVLGLKSRPTKCSVKAANRRIIGKSSDNRCQKAPSTIFPAEYRSVRYCSMLCRGAPSIILQFEPGGNIIKLLLLVILNPCYIRGGGNRGGEGYSI